MAVALLIGNFPIYKLEFLMLETCLSQFFTLILHHYFYEVNMKNEGKIKKYLLDSFGWDVAFEDFDIHKGKLPYAMLGAADYAIVRCLDFYGVAIAPRSEDDFRMTKNLVDSLERRTGLPAMLILENLDSYQRRVLIEKRINFIVPDKQIYLPTLGIFMNERGLGMRQTLSDRLSAIAAAIIILQLSKGNLKGKSVSQAAEIMGYSVKTISLAVNELALRGLITLKPKGRKKLLDFTLPQKELWEKVYSMAETPVERRLFTNDREIASEIGIKASDSALSEVSMLTPPQKEIFAIYARDPRLKDMHLNPNDGTTIIEIWKTDPKLSAVDGKAGIFSLALSYKEDEDPRIRKEINNILTETL